MQMSTTFTSDTQGNVTAYPLTWPQGWKRVESHRRTASGFGPHSISECADKIISEERLMPGHRCVISTNLHVRLDGLPYSNQRQPDDSGAAVYFQYKDKPIVFACDRWRKVEENLWAIAKHLEALRGQERWGVGNLEQAFQGYLALPAPRQWWTVLGVSPQASDDEVRAAYRALARQTHPDAGGEQDAFVRVQAAYERAMQGRE
jgi:hypothetical protein